MNWGPQMNRWREKSKVWCRCGGRKSELVVENANIVEE